MTEIINDKKVILFEQGQPILEMISKFLQDRVLVQTGIGGMKALNKEVGMTIERNRIAEKELGEGNMYFDTPELPVIFQLAPVFDPIIDRDIRNPFVNGFRQSSYDYVFIQDGKIIAEAVCITKQ